jgi:type VI secretion system protein ImpH
MGSLGRDVNSELMLTLFTADHDEAREWLPGGGLLSDLRVLLQVYLGWRCTARLRLSLPIDCLPVSALSGSGVLLGMTAGLGLKGRAVGKSDTIIIHLGRYQGLQVNPQEREPAHVDYYFC